jgi:hypothetical protein
MSPLNRCVLDLQGSRLQKGGANDGKILTDVKESRISIRRKSCRSIFRLFVFATMSEWARSTLGH